MRSILLLAPVPTHPSETGASARVRHMGERLVDLGHEVHFLHLQQTLRADRSAMEQYWRERLHVFRSLSPASFLGRARRKAIRLAGKAFHLNLPVDCYFDAEAAEYIRGLMTEHEFDAVILSYVFYSRLLDAMPAPVRKLIDTHDVFANRYQLYRSRGQASEFFSTTPAGEARALDRADAVLAIQEWDASHFRSLTARPVVVVGHLAPVVAGSPVASSAPGPAADGPGILFVGGPMGINVHGVQWFLERVLPAVRRRVPAAELWLAGGIGERVGQGVAGVRRLGFVESLGDVYRQAAVVINPQQFGTGLSIKSVDALLHGRPLVTTASGARGLEDGAEAAFLQTDSAEAFGEAIIELLADPERATSLAARASEFASVYHQRQLRALADVVQAAP
jgi:glycosyltransferase involved in cell wall biosynthesis